MLDNVKKWIAIDEEAHSDLMTELRMLHQMKRDVIVEKSIQ